MKKFIVKLVVGKAKAFPTGQERISTLANALKWRLPDLLFFLPRLDAQVNDKGIVGLFFMDKPTKKN
jgi:hypothetical protein